MNIQTTGHNIYSYLQRTNEIVRGIVADDDYAWEFEPLKRFSAMPNVDMFVVSITEQCNLRCSYCCYSGAYTDNRTHSALSMTEADIDDLLDFIKELSNGKPFRIAFYGGEPLTCFHLVQQVVLKAAGIWNEKVSFSISTNGTLLTNERIDWLEEHEVELYISVDGTAPYHDKNRKDIVGNGTFSRIHSALGYIESKHSDYILQVYLIMTLSLLADLDCIAEEWHKDPLLRNIAPTMISGLAPNFSKGVEKKDWETVKRQHLHLLDVYQRHPDYLVLKTYFNQCIAYWKNRPVVEADGAVPMATCLPQNTKLYIDAKMQIGVCEKISDNCRIGNVRNGIDWNKANSLVGKYYEKRSSRCRKCPAVRMCDQCLTAVTFNDSQWDILCHNERVNVRLNFLIFCEMAERGMIKVVRFPKLHSERCQLTEITVDDVLTLQEIMNDLETRKYLPDLCKSLRSRMGVERFIDVFRSYHEDHEGFLWGIRLDDILIGFIAIMDLSFNPTIFFAMHPNYRNQGYMQESVSSVTQYIRVTKLTSELHTEVNVNNIASQKVLERCGYSVGEQDVDVKIIRYKI